MMETRLIRLETVRDESAPSLGDAKKTLEDAVETTDYKSPLVALTHVLYTTQNHSPNLFK